MVGLPLNPSIEKSNFFGLDFLASRHKTDGMMKKPSLLQILREWYPAQTVTIRGTFIRSTGLTPPVVRQGIFGDRCTDKTAKALAKAYGYPGRWPELVR